MSAVVAIRRSPTMPNNGRGRIRSVRAFGSATAEGAGHPVPATTKGGPAVGAEGASARPGGGARASARM
jgi:hypothetical protein